MSLNTHARKTNQTKKPLIFILFFFVFFFKTLTEILKMQHILSKNIFVNNTEYTSEAGRWGHALTPAAGMIAEWVALLCSVVLLMELPDGTQVQFVAHALRGVQGAWLELVFTPVPFCQLWIRQFLSRCINLVSFLVSYFCSKTQPQLRKAALDRDNVILCLSGPGLKAKGSLISLTVMEYCPLHSLKRAAFVSQI